MYAHTHLSLSPSLSLSLSLSLTLSLSLLQGELADYINAQVSESQTKKTLDTLKNKVQGLAVSQLAYCRPFMPMDRHC